MEYTTEQRQDPAFYTYGDTSVVWEEEGNPFYVLCCGEMKIYADDGNDQYTIRTTSDLESFGIFTDADLKAWSDKGEELFFWENNSWFEVRNENAEEYSEPFHELNDAINHAKESNR